MSDFFADDAEPPAAPTPPRRESRRPRPLVLTLIVMAVFLVGFSIFANIWTEKLWFSSVGYSDVFSKLVWTKIGLFAFFGTAMALIVGANLFFAFRLRPVFRPNSPEQANLERYREVITPIRVVLLVATSLVFGIFAGASATGQWRTYLLWQNGQSFGERDPYFHKDIGFYVFTLPWLHWLVDFTLTALVIGLIAAIFVHYVYGGIRLQARVDKVSGPAQAQMSVVLGLLVLLKGADYYLDRFDLNTAGGGLVTGMTYSRQHAMLPAKNILMAIALVCAILFFANVFRRTWTLPGMGLALFALSAIVLGVIWPATVQKFQVKPDEPDKESSYIANNIKATVEAFQLPSDTKPVEYTPPKNLVTPSVENSPTTPLVRLLDPLVVRDAFDQLQQQYGYYTVGGVLDVDRYPVDGQDRDMVVAAREVDLSGLPDGQKKWANEHTVYTHGYGVIAAYGNQRNQAGKEPSTFDGTPIWAEQDLPPKGVLTSETNANGSTGYRDQIYYGEHSPKYSIVGKKPGGSDVELDVPQGDGAAGDAQTSTYDGKGGVKIGSLFDKLIYSVKFGDANLVLSSRVNSNSKILYDRAPREEVQKVAPWLTVDSDALPAVVDGKIVWILDGYTTTDRYPLAEKRSLQEMTSDSISPRSAYATLPTDNINYMRNAVKATVDAYDGTVTIYEWDTSDPILQAWERAFPGVVKSRDSIPADLLAHFRYPEDLFKVQRNLFADYHVTNPKTFYEGSDKWQVPVDPDNQTNTQPPYRLSIAADPTSSSETPVFSLTSVYTRSKKQNLASFMSVNADAASQDYGKFTILRMQDASNVPGPSQMANQFSNTPKVSTAKQPFKVGTDTGVVPGNLLTIPVDHGFLYVQPLYTTRNGASGKYPVLQFVLASYGDKVGIGPTLTRALENIGATTADTGGVAPPSSDGNGTGSTGNGSDNGNGTGSGQALSTEALALLQQANQKFRSADAALKRGDLSTYAQDVKEGQALVTRAIQVSKQADKKSTAKKSTAKGTG